MLRKKERIFLTFVTNVTNTVFPSDHLDLNGLELVQTDDIPSNVGYRGLTTS